MNLDRLKSLSTLQWALIVSVLIHASLLTIRFVNPEGFRRVFEDYSDRKSLVERAVLQIFTKAARSR